MIRIETLVQLKAFARQDALLLALVWTASFACMTIVQAGIIGNLLALATPFVVGWRLTKFRDHALYGYISFRRAFAYCAYVFFYASTTARSRRCLPTQCRSWHPSMRRTA